MKWHKMVYKHKDYVAYVYIDKLACGVPTKPVEWFTNYMGAWQHNKSQLEFNQNWLHVRFTKQDKLKIQQLKLELL